MAHHTVHAEQTKPILSSELSEEDRGLLAKVDSALDAGRALQAWWEQADAEKQYQVCFPLTRAFNQPETSFGFFGQAAIQGRNMPVMGTVEEMLYDQPKHSNRERLRDELREFVLHYFLRVTDFREPRASTGTKSSNLPEWLRDLGWCPDSQFVSTGFGYSQYFYKKRDNGLVAKFPEDQRFAIVDLRRLIEEYEWIVVKVRIFDFDLKLAPFGGNRPQAVVPLREESYLVLSSDFLTDETNPSPEIAGSYGFGYAFIKHSPAGGVLAYGPGLFDAAFKRITFRILRSGQMRVHLAFVANRPTRLLNFPFFDWTMRLADVASLGMASRFLSSPEVGNEPDPPTHDFDPLIASITLANLFSNGRAAEDLCVSREQLEKDMLLQHFRQHYQMLLGSLFTWRQIADWQDANGLPAWVITGTTS
jgi:hypothetical protein